MAGYELATAYINLAVGTNNLAKQIGGTFKQSEKVAAESGKSMGARFAKAFAAQRPVNLKNSAEKAAREVEAASRRVMQARNDEAKASQGVTDAARRIEDARLKEEAASRKVEIAEAKLQELRASGTAKNSQLLAAEDRLAKAKEDVAKASRGIETAEESMARAKDRAALASQRVESAVEDETRAKREADKANDALVQSQDRVASSADDTGRAFGTLKGRIQAAFRGNFKDAFKRVPKDADRAADQVERRFKEAGTESSGGFARAFSGAFSGLLAYVSLDQIGTQFADAIKGSGELEQSVGAIQSVFKNSSSAMLEWSKSASTAVGLSQNEYNELGALLGAQLKNAGTSMKDLAPKTNELIGLGADLSSMFGGTTREAVESISSALKGERDPIEKYGVTLRQAAIDAKAAEMGFEKVGGSFDQEAQAAATLALIMEQTTDAQGNFSKESDTFAHQQQVAAAQWDNLKTIIGGAFLPALTQVMTYITSTAIPALSGFGGWVKENAKMLGLIGAVLGAAAAAYGGYVLWVNAATLASKIAAAAQVIWNSALLASPITWVVIAIGALVGALVWFFTQTEAGAALWGQIWAGIKTAVGVVAEWFNTYIMPTLTLAIQTIGGYFSWLWTDIVQPVWSAIWQAIQEAWALMQPIFSQIGLFIKAYLIVYFRLLGTVVQTIMKIIWTIIQVAWEVIIKPIFTAIKWFIVTILVPAFRLWAQAVSIQVNAIIAVIKFMWHTWVKPILTALVSYIKNVIIPAFKALASRISDAWSRITSTMKAAWTIIRDNIFTPLKTWITQTVPNAFNSGVKAISRFWNKLKDAAKKPVKFVVETVINKGIIENFNKIIDWFPGEAKKIDPISPPKGFAIGGWTGPGARLKPAGIVHADEYVLQKSAQRRITREHGRGFLDYMNRTGKVPGYARGGAVKGGTLWDAAQWWIAKGARGSEHSWFNNGRRITGGHSPNSLHYRDQAVDLNYGPPGQNSIEMNFFDRWIKEFQVSFPGIRTIWRAPGHYNHLHIDTSKGANMGSGGGSAGGGGFDLLKPFNDLKEKISDGLGDSLFAKIIKGAAKKMVAAPIEWIKSKFGGVWEAAGDVATSVGNWGVKRQVQAVAATYGWGLGEQWDAIVRIVEKESSWNPKAANPTSSARGLFQKMTSIHGPVEPTAARQARWGLKYIKDRYGTPVAALAFHNRHNWYHAGGLVAPTLFDRGGVLKPGVSLVENRTGKPEYILPAHVTDALLDGGKPGGVTIGKVIIHANSHAEGRDAVRGMWDEIRRIERGGKYATI